MAPAGRCSPTSCCAPWPHRTFSRFPNASPPLTASQTPRAGRPFEKELPGPPLGGAAWCLLTAGRICFGFPAEWCSRHLGNDGWRKQRARRHFGNVHSIGMEALCHPVPLNNLPPTTPLRFPQTGSKWQTPKDLGGRSLGEGGWRGGGCPTLCAWLPLTNQNRE